VREDESGKDNELPCVMRGKSEGVCTWRSWQSSMGSSLHRQGAAYRKERLVIFKDDRIGCFKEDRVSGLARMIIWRTWYVVKRLNRNRVVEILSLV